MITKVLATALLYASTALGQTAAVPAASTSSLLPSAAGTGPAKSYAFEVISIHKRKDWPQPQERAHDGATPDGYRSHQQLMFLLGAAYAPRAGGMFYPQSQIKGYPDWVMNETYDVDAHIADADRAEWEMPGRRYAMLQSMLQALLADRCKLVLHREDRETRDTILVLAKGGPKFNESDPTAKLPDGDKLPLGGVRVIRGDSISFYDVSMLSFLAQLSILANSSEPIHDKTGLTGRYDITLEVASGGDLREMVLSALPSLGLKLDTEKVETEIYVIDHIERPSED